MKFLKQEHIGEEVLIENKKTKRVTQGKIIDETKNTYLLMTGDKGHNKKIIKVIKEQNNIIFINQKLKINGSKLNKRPEDRIKMKEK